MSKLQDAGKKINPVSVAIGAVALVCAGLLLYGCMLWSNNDQHRRGEQAQRPAVTSSAPELASSATDLPANCSEIFKRSRTWQNIDYQLNLGPSCMGGLTFPSFAPDIDANKTIDMMPVELVHNEADTYLKIGQPESGRVSYDKYIPKPGTYGLRVVIYQEAGTRFAQLTLIPQAKPKTTFTLCAPWQRNDKRCGHSHSTR